MRDEGRRGQMDRVAIAVLALLSVLLTGASGDCKANPSPSRSAGQVAPPPYGQPTPNPDHGAPDRRKQPQPVADPSALAKVGNDKKSGILHLDWHTNVAFTIAYSDGHGRQVIPEFLPQYGDNGGRVDIPFVVTDPVNVYITGEPVSKRDRNGKWEDWQVWCHIKWNGQIVDTDNSDVNGSVRCDAPVHP